MNIQIDSIGGIPIYEQIVRQIKNLIINKELQGEDALPSMRVLAKELHVSVITTKRVYEELERDGFIYSVTGKGSFVRTQDAGMLKEQHLKEIEKQVAAICDDARRGGISLEELTEILEIMYKGE